MPAQNIIDSVLQKNRQQKRIKINFSVSEETNSAIDKFIEQMKNEGETIDKSMLLEQWTDKLVDTLRRSYKQRKNKKVASAVNNAAQPSQASTNQNS
jgi:hypothetical protein